MYTTHTGEGGGGGGGGGRAHRQRFSTTCFDSKKHVFLVLRTGFEPSSPHDDDDDDDDDDVLYSAVSPCCCSMLGALGRVESLEACSQWALLIVCKSLTTTVLFQFNVHTYLSFFQ